MQHLPVLLDEILTHVPTRPNGTYLDLTYGGGGHFFAVMGSRPGWRGEAWDQDPLAETRFNERAHGDSRLSFRARNFSESVEGAYDFILADLGVSSFQLDDPTRGFGFRSQAPVDFRMNPAAGPDFPAWIAQRSPAELERIFENFGEEPRAKKLAQAMKTWPPSAFANASAFADAIARTLAYSSASRVHPATRAFQALRIAINDELGALESLLRWAPLALATGGRLALISFHSLEDRVVKNRFKDLTKDEGFAILTKKPLVPGERETEANPRSRSAKLRILERTGQVARDHKVSEVGPPPESG